MKVGVVGASEIVKGKKFRLDEILNQFDLIFFMQNFPFTIIKNNRVDTKLNHIENGYLCEDLKVMTNKYRVKHKKFMDRHSENKNVFETATVFQIREKNYRKKIFGW